MLRFILVVALGLLSLRRSTSADQVVAFASGATAVAFSPDGRSLVVVGEDKQVRVWDLAAGLLVQSFPPQPDDAFSGVLAARGRFVTASLSGQIKVRDFSDGRVLGTFQGPSAGVFGGWVASSPDGSMLAASGGNPASPSGNLVRVLDASGRQLFQTSAGVGDLYSMAFSPDGRLLVAAGLDTDIRVWDARTGELKRLIQEMKLAMFDLAFSPDGRYLAVAGADRTVYLWDAQSWKMVRRFIGQPETIAALRFSPDGGLLVTAGMNELNFASPVQVILWDFASGRKLRTWTAEHMVQGLAFSPDGNSVAVADGSKNLKVWAVPAKTAKAAR